MSDKNLEEKFQKDFQLVFNSKYVGSAAYRHDFSLYKAGYELAKKETEASLNEAIEVIKSFKNCEADVHGIAVRFLNKMKNKTKINSLNKALHGLNRDSGEME